MRLRLRSAFTLIEMVVVIGIISTLMGILIPVVSSVRFESRNTQCLSNLKQNWTVIDGWVTSHKDQLPMCEFLPAIGPVGPEGGLPQKLDSRLPKESSTWLCPADFDEDSVSTGTSYMYLPGLIRFVPQIQLEVFQVLAAQLSLSDAQRTRLRDDLESRLSTRFYELDTQRVFPLLLDSQDRHPGARPPRNGVFMDGSTGEATLDEAVPEG
ncbi:MAG: type II secretion system protein [Planctomycetota bacterium]|nr:type II secretion system protein [Planctomycetota bacterium]